MGKELVCGLLITKVVNPPTLYYPSCVEVDYWSGGFVPYPSSERLICCLARCLPLLCEVDFVVDCALPLVRVVFG